MYEQLKTNAKIKANDEWIQEMSNVYFKYNKKIDEEFDYKITCAMADNRKSCCLVVIERPKYNYDYIFKEYYEEPYKKSILDRLKEKYQLPHFECCAGHEFAYYVVEVKWDTKDDCKCIIF